MENTSINERIAILVAHYGRGKNTEFASIIGTTEANIRGYIKGVLPKADILQKIAISCDGLSTDWLLTGKGEMLRTSTPSQYGTANLMLSGHDNVQVQGNSNNVATQPHPPTQTIDRALDEIAEQRKLVQTAQAQIDRLLAIIERLTAPTN